MLLNSISLPSTLWLESRKQKEGYMRCGGFFVGALTLGGCTTVVPEVFAVVTFPVKVGRKRACVTASKREAILISVGWLKEVPMKLMPIGIPRTFAAGALMMGYPGGPAKPELAKRK